METHYLFQNCNNSLARRRGGGLPFWKVFMGNSPDARPTPPPPPPPQLSAETTGAGTCDVVEQSSEGASECENAQVENVTPKRRRAVGTFDVGAMFEEAAASDNLLERKQFNLKLVKEFRINNGSTGFGYDKIFADGIDERLKTVTVDEPYMRNKFQITNFVAFCELLVSRAPNLREIVLCTQAGQTAQPQFWAQLGQLRVDLMVRDVALKVRTSDTMHDREIRFDNGWTYRIGRGLDYFYKQHQLTLGLTDFNLRRCHETVVCILREMRSRNDL